MSDSFENIRFKVGDGATIFVGSDRYAATVVEVSKTGHRVIVQRDSATLVGGNFFGTVQEHEFRRNPDGKKTTFTRRRDGGYREQGCHYNGARFLGAGRDQYRDPHF
tara:strand:+ start:466 stop:786 length:321 start_codon:yes stop_codon:yes gene_type:complete